MEAPVTTTTFPLRIPVLLGLSPAATELEAMASFYPAAQSKSMRKLQSGNGAEP
jgi:hypothetical protein